MSLAVWRATASPQRDRICFATLSAPPVNSGMLADHQITSSKMRRLLIFATGLCVIAIPMSFIIVNSIRSEGVPHLIACIDSAPPPVGWACGISFHTFGLTDEEIKGLNQQAGTQWASIMRDKAEAEDMLDALLSQGVDVNARDYAVNGMTALHIAALAPDPDQVARLLKAGADPGIKDLTGRLAADYAGTALGTHPNDADRLRVAKLLGAR